jgi:hypothetical protein
VRVARAEDAGVEVVHLAPVRAAADGAGDLLERAEVLAVRHAGELVDRDVGRVPALRGRQPDVIGRGDPDLDREHHRVLQLRHYGP